MIKGKRKGINIPRRAIRGIKRKTAKREKRAARSRTRKSAAAKKRTKERTPPKKKAEKRAGKKITTKTSPRANAKSVLIPTPLSVLKKTVRQRKKFQRERRPKAPCLHSISLS